VFEADTPMKMFMHHVQTTPIPPSQRSELPIPRDVDALVLACLEKDPAKRPQNANELLRMVRQCRLSEAWDNDTARAWWDMHLLELTTQHTLADARLDVAGSSLVTR
jgi:serine/threonine protein kinase